MKKRAMQIFGFLLLVGLLTACMPQSKESINNEIKEDNENTFSLAFEEVERKDVPNELKRHLNKIREKRGYLSVTKEGQTYLYISSGKKSSGGYGLKVISIEESKGTINVFVEETSPQKGMMVTQAITYPSVYLKIEGHSESVHVYVPDKGFTGGKLKHLNP